MELTRLTGFLRIWQRFVPVFLFSGVSSLASRFLARGILTMSRGPQLRLVEYASVAGGTLQ